ALFDDALEISVRDHGPPNRDPHLDADILVDLVDTALAAHESAIAKKWLAKLPDAAREVDPARVAKL
ncbi:MAG TPA: hypothetical protein VGC41_19975, partial [Kofleriaceae bacterium]